MKKNIELESLVMDLKRVALGYHRGSITMAKNFSKEALKRKKEIIKNTSLPLYVKNILERIEKLFQTKDIEKIAEDSLMFSTLLQNYLLFSL